MDPDSYSLEDVQQALERRGISRHEWDHWRGSLHWKEKEVVSFLVAHLGVPLGTQRISLRWQLLDVLKRTIQTDRARKRRLDALPLSYQRRLLLPYELIAHIQSFLVGPLALSTHVALSQLNKSVRTYLFGSTEELVEERWRQICLHAGMGIVYEDLTEPYPVGRTWENSALRTAEWRQMANSTRWQDWNEALLAFAGSEVRVLSRKEVKNDDVQLQINPALSYMRLMETNELDFAIKDRNDQWLSVYDDRSCVMLLTFPPVSELSVAVEGVSGTYEKLELRNEDGIVIWDLWTSRFDELWFPVDGILVAEFVEGDKGDYISSIPTNHDGELCVEEDDDHEPRYSSSAAVARRESRDVVLEEIIESHG
ncbi:hypothetical protein BDY24DRAFT_377692 [Mrakia frigida]|uniref:uncharacterized protein n=1 Tax=Mrakia frigida TaxID=29902 RepID=UPI003FCC0BC1